MGSLFDGTDGMENIREIYEKMEDNYDRMKAKCHRSSCSISGKLWRLRHECGIGDRQQTLKIMLDKAVAILAKRRRMPGWFNRCPVAAGITDPRIDNNYRVDLVHCCKLCRCARLIELKWKSDYPIPALRKILRYGAAYIFCRVHKGSLTFPAEFLIELDARHVSLEVIAPRHFYHGYDEGARIARMSQTLDEFVGSKTGGTLSMSLNALAFPKEFDRIPFNDGKDVKQKCDTDQLTPEGQAVRDAFNHLTPVWP